MTITNKCDLQYTISNLVDNKGNQLRLSDCNSFVAKFYTDNKSNYSSCTKLNNELYNIKIEDEDIALINSSDLERMDDGVLNFEFTYSIPDNSFSDGTFDNTIVGNTNYYIKLNSNSGSDIDLSDYYTKNEVYNKIEVDEKIENIQTGDIDLSDYYIKSETNSLLNNKVDKAEGKQLSSNDYTNEDKTKLAGLSNYDDSAIKESINLKANSTDVYSKSEIDDKNYLTSIPDSFATKTYVTAEINKTDIPVVDVDKQYVDTELLKKQDILKAGTNITITDNTISSTDTIYDDSELRTLIDSKANSSNVYDKTTSDSIYMKTGSIVVSNQEPSSESDAIIWFQI